MRRSKEGAEQTRQAILDAAEQMFGSQGVAASTLEKISRQAGVTRGALYWHFKDKSDLLQALHERSMPVQVVVMQSAADQGHDDPLGFLENAASEMLLAFEQDARQQRMFAIMNSQSPDEEGAAWIAKVNADLFRTLAALLRHAHSRAMLTPDFTPEEAAVILLATMNGLLSEWLRSGKSFALADLGTRLMERQMTLLRHGPMPAAQNAPD